VPVRERRRGWCGTRDRESRTKKRSEGAPLDPHLLLLFLQNRSFLSKTLPPPKTSFHTPGDWALVVLGVFGSIINGEKGKEKKEGEQRKAEK